MKSKWSKYFMIFLAVNLLGLAVACLLKSGLGCDPIALLSKGISVALSTSFGIASFLYNVVTICIAFFLAKEFLGTGTVVYGLLSGFVIDFYCMLFQWLPTFNDISIYNILYFIVGEFLMSAAFAILMQLNLGMTALDALLTAVSKKTGITYAIFKIGIDAIFVITGSILGGPFGIGTIISVLITGILVDKIVKIIKIIQTKKEDEVCSHEKNII